MTPLLLELDRDDRPWKITHERCRSSKRSFRLSRLSAIIRPTETEGAAMGALRALTANGLFIGQSPEFFQLLRDLAEDADEARRGDQ